MADEKKKKKAYEEFKEDRRAAEADKSRAGRDIGAIPPVRDADRRLAGEGSFKTFCETYGKLTFTLDWSADHLTVIVLMETVIIVGGSFAIAMPRGSGKTSLVEWAVIWAALTGRRKFIVIIGASEGHARQLLDSIKMELTTNALLLEDFPEVVFPIQCLEGITQRCKGQLHDGAQTHIAWRDRFIVLPTIKNSSASGCIIRVAGIKGAIRGMKYKRPDGETIRPDLAIPDDPQTDESARSIDQCNERERVVLGTILGSAGPGKKISLIMPCTVVRKGDLADRFLDRKAHPEFQGVRTKLLPKVPTDEKLWQEYWEVRSEGILNGDNGKAGNAFYRKKKKQLNAGGEASWPQRFNADELSAIQHAMNLKLSNEAVFAAEYQNEPLDDKLLDAEVLTVETIVAKVNAIKRQVVPHGLSHLVAMIDVQSRALYYAIVGWSDRFDGQVVDYGAFPDQGLNYFIYRKVQKTLKRTFPRMSDDAAIYAGLGSLTDQMLAREWKSTSGTVMHVERCLIDSGNWNDLIHQFCRESKHAARLVPSKGMGIGAAKKPMSDWQKRPGDRVGAFWRMPGQVPRGGVRHVVFDTNHWKSFLHERLATPPGDAGCLQLYAGASAHHRMLAQHVVAEYRTRTTGQGREVDEWNAKPGDPDNHLLDCLVGCAVAGSMSGCSLLGQGTAVGAKKQKLSLAAMQQKRRP